MKKIIIAILIVCAVLVSMFPLAEKARNIENYQETVASINEKQEVVTKITIGAAAVSTALATLPGDVTTPIANHVLDLSQYLIIVLVVLVLEEMLLPVLGLAAFKYIIPLALLFLLVYVFIKKEWLFKAFTKFAIFGLVLALIVPASVSISDIIYEENKETITATMTELEKMDIKTENVEVVKGEFKLTQIAQYISNIMKNIKSEAKNVTEKVEGYINVFIDATAMLMVTCMVIPVGVVFLIVWLMKVLFNINISMKIPKFNRTKKEVEQEEVVK